ncbi:MAG: cytochrome c maturation protein CcmE [Calditrichia bacterium]
MKIKVIIGVIIVAGLVALAAMTLKSTMTPYVSVKEAKLTGSRCQVKGVVVPGSAIFDMEKKIFRFKLEDEQNEVIDVVHNGVKPGNFDQASHVVVVGKYSDGYFDANQILVKCPSKYEAEGVTS